MFVTLTRSDFFSAGQDDARRFNQSTQKRFDTIYSQQNDEDYLKQNRMPKVCQGMSYTPPTVASHKAGPKHENAFVVSNDAHCKQTNNGFKRGESGGFYAH